MFLVQSMLTMLGADSIFGELLISVWYVSHGRPPSLNTTLLVGLCVSFVTLDADLSLCLSSSTQT